MQNKMNKTNLVPITMTINATINVTEELKTYLEQKYPYTPFDSDKDYAIIALYLGSDNCLPKHITVFKQEVAIYF